VAIKDLFKRRSIKTALNVRSFLEKYGTEKETEAYIKMLIDLGVVIVGNTKMTAFAGGEKAPKNWIDFQCPFDPRADGDQAPGGGTTGDAAAFAGYEWLDYSIGSDI
jgi:Asp-tRNA(Asn)/Glu-tRNA(Gln) amidotransferase A subunit family amidase